MQQFLKIYFWDNFEKLVHLVGFIIRIYDDGPEHQNFPKLRSNSSLVMIIKSRDAGNNRITNKLFLLLFDFCHSNSFSTALTKVQFNLFR